MNQSAIAPELLGFIQQRNDLASIGRPISTPSVQVTTSQYFEKARLDESAGNASGGERTIQLALIVEEMRRLCAQSYHAGCAALPIGGEQSTISYADLPTLTGSDRAVAFPTGFQGGVMVRPDGSVFVPYDSQLSPVPGHVVSPRIWEFLQQPTVFPDGWLADLGLPLSDAIDVVVTKGAASGRHVTVQFFQRNYVTYDAANPAGWQVELGNVGLDRLRLTLWFGAPLIGE